MKMSLFETTTARVRQLVKEKTSPRNRDEQEIAGYRDILNTIHESYEFIPFKSEIILQLHRDLLSYTDKSFGGQFKNTQNHITESYGDGTVATRFTPLEPYETPQAVKAICISYQEALDRQVIDPLILIPIFICDFLCIHPFNDGNGQISTEWHIGGTDYTPFIKYFLGISLNCYKDLEDRFARPQEYSLGDCQ